MDDEPERPLDDALKFVEAHAEGLSRLADHLEAIRARLDGIYRHLGDVGQRLPHVVQRDPSQEPHQDFITLQEASGAQRESPSQPQEADRRFQELANRFDSLTADGMTIRQAVEKALQTLTNLEHLIQEVVRRQEEMHTGFASPQEAQTASEPTAREEVHRVARNLEAAANRLRDLVTGDRVKIDRRLAEIRFTLEATVDQVKKGWRLTIGFLFLLILLVIAALLRPEIASWLASARVR